MDENKMSRYLNFSKREDALMFSFCLSRLLRDWQQRIYPHSDEDLDKFIDLFSFQDVAPNIKEIEYYADVLGDMHKNSIFETVFGGLGVEGLKYAFDSLFNQIIGQDGALQEHLMEGWQYLLHNDALVTAYVELDDDKTKVKPQFFGLNFPVAVLKLRGEPEFYRSNNPDREYLLLFYKVHPLAETDVIVSEPHKIFTILKSRELLTTVSPTPRQKNFIFQQMWQLPRIDVYPHYLLQVAGEEIILPDAKRVVLDPAQKTVGQIFETIRTNSTKEKKQEHIFSLFMLINWLANRLPPVGDEYSRTNELRLPAMVIGYIFAFGLKRLILRKKIKEITHVPGLILYGKPHSGKSTMARVGAAVWGLPSSEESHNLEEDTMAGIGLYFGLPGIAEIEEVSKQKLPWVSKLFKRLADSLTIRETSSVTQDKVIYPNILAPILTTNHRDIETVLDEALQGRFISLPFETETEHEQKEIEKLENYKLTIENTRGALVLDILRETYNIINEGVISLLFDLVKSEGVHGRHTANLVYILSGLNVFKRLAWQYKIRLPEVEGDPFYFEKTIISAYRYLLKTKVEPVDSIYHVFVELNKLLSIARAGVDLEVGLSRQSKDIFQDMVHGVHGIALGRSTEGTLRFLITRQWAQQHGFNAVKYLADAMYNFFYEHKIKLTDEEDDNLTVKNRTFTTTTGDRLKRRGVIVTEDLIRKAIDYFDSKECDDEEGDAE